MKIAIFSDNFYPELSGIADSLIGLAKALSQRGHRINFYVPKYSGRNYRAVNLKNTAEPDWGDNIKIIRFFSFPFPSGTKQGRMVLPTLWRWLKVRRFTPDIIHTNLFFGVGLEALLAAKFLKVPLVGTNHTVVSEFVRYSPVKTKNLAARFSAYVNWYYNHCDLVTAPGQALLTEMEQAGLKVSHQVVANPLERNGWLPITIAAKAKLKKDFNLTPHTLIYAGRLAPEKNIDVLIRALPEALKKISDVSLLLAGHGSSFEELKKLTQKLGLSAAVRFLGTVDKETLAQFYQASEIFVIASTSEVQSMTILQAMACGLPVIGARARGIIDGVKNSGLLFEPGNHSDLAEKIVSLLNSSELMEQFRQNALAYVENFSGDKIAEQWERIYTKLQRRCELHE